MFLPIPLPFLLNSFLFSIFLLGIVIRLHESCDLDFSCMLRTQFGSFYGFFIAYQQTPQFLKIFPIRESRYSDHFIFLCTVLLFIAIHSVIE